jgi:phospholipid transport system substrate-binding protein
MIRMGWMGATLAVILAMLALIGLPTLPSQAACPVAGVVKNAGEAFIDAAARSNEAAFTSALSRYTDVNAVAFFALGQYRKSLPPARQSEYLKNARRYMARVLLDNSRSFRSSRDLTIEKCNGNLVETSLGGRSRMLWRLSGGRIRDVRVSGVWLGIQLRSKFTEIIRRNNGDVNALLAYLRR